jgi:hypothetical protein
MASRSKSYIVSAACTMPVTPDEFSGLAEEARPTQLREILMPSRSV